MGCECYTIGGPFIAEDPNCPAHGRFGLQHDVERLEDEVERLRSVLAQFADDASWQMNGICDPNSSRFCGQELAQKALKG